MVFQFDVNIGSLTCRSEFLQVFYMNLFYELSCCQIYPQVNFNDVKPSVAELAQYMIALHEGQFHPCLLQLFDHVIVHAASWYTINLDVFRVNLCVLPSHVCHAERTERFRSGSSVLRQASRRARQIRRDVRCGANDDSRHESGRGHVR